jgi:hypothetical protein
MRWLTRDWHGFGGRDMSDAACEAATAAYEEHNDVILPLLPEQLRVFAGEPGPDGYLSLHDGRPEWWAYVPGQSLTLQIFCPLDEPSGYRRVTLQYRGSVELRDADEGELAAWLDDPKTEFLFQEIDIDDGGRFEHRHLLWPIGEFGVRFSDATSISAPATAAAYEKMLATKGVEDADT